MIFVAKTSSHESSTSLSLESSSSSSSSISTSSSFFYEFRLCIQLNECYDNEDELQSFRHKARQQDKVYDEREESCWILHLRTGIFYLKVHEGVINEVSNGAAIFASRYWLRNSDMYRV
ncbi:hypothetical protein Tco_0121629 [Tanacetum coccineum]